MADPMLNDAQIMPFIFPLQIIDFENNEQSSESAP